MWANTYISGHVLAYVMHNAVGIIVGSTYALNTNLCVFAPQVARFLTCYGLVG